MRVYILTDLEGVCGVISHEQLSPGNVAYERARRQQLAEINAVVRGLSKAGATEVVVYNGHGPAWDMDPQALERPARVVAGHPVEKPLPALDGSFAAFCVLGQHAMAGSAAAVLEHTGSHLHYHEVQVNGRSVGEFGLQAYLAGEFGVPTVLASGDSAFVKEAQELVPGILTVETKTAISRHAALNRHPQDVLEELEEKAALALERAGEATPCVASPPIEITVRCGSPVSIQRNRLVPGIEVVDERTYRIRAETMLEAATLFMLTGWIV